MRRFKAFTDDQARQLADEFNHLWHRLLAMTMILAVFTAGGYAMGLYVNQQQTERAHSLALDACHRSQDGRRALQALIAIAIPLHSPNRTAVEQQSVDQFYHQINTSKALKVPVCDE